MQRSGRMAGDRRGYNRKIYTTAAGIIKEEKFMDLSLVLAEINGPRRDCFQAKGNSSAI